MSRIQTFILVITYYLPTKLTIENKMVLKYCYIFLCAFYCKTHKSVAENVHYTEYDISKLCESYSGAFGHHSGTTIDLGEQDNKIGQLCLTFLIKIIRV